MGRAVRTECRLPRPACGERAGVRGTLRQKDGGVAGQGPPAHCPGRIVAARPHAGRIRVVDTHSQPATGRLQIRPPGAHRPVLRRFRLSRPALDCRARWRRARGTPQGQAARQRAVHPMAFSKCSNPNSKNHPSPRPSPRKRGEGANQQRCRSHPVSEMRASVNGPVRIVWLRVVQRNLEEQLEYIGDDNARTATYVRARYLV